MNQLKECGKKHFDFLNQFGYSILEADTADKVSFIGKNNQIDVMFSAIGYELTCQFVDNDNNTFSLQDGLLYESIEEFKGLYQMASKEEFEKGVAYLAKAVKLIFQRIDVSDSLNFQKIYQFSVETRKKSLEKYYLEADLKKAEEYLANKEYDKAKELLEKNIEKLSKSQLKKLEYIRKAEQGTVLKMNNGSDAI